MDARELTVELIAHNTVSYNSNTEVMKFLRQRMLEIDCQVEWVEYVDPDGVQKVNLIGKKRRKPRSWRSRHRTAWSY